MKTPNKKDEAIATKAAKTLCQIIAKHGLKCAQFDMKVDNGPFEGTRFTVTIEAVEDCLCEDCLNEERNAE
jgi:hypothetical protein